MAQMTTSWRRAAKVKSGSVDARGRLTSADIHDAEANLIFQVDYEARTYAGGSAAAFRKEQAGAMAEADRDVEEMQKDVEEIFKGLREKLPKEYAAELEKEEAKPAKGDRRELSMKEFAELLVTRKSEVKPTGQRDTIAGHPAEKFLVYEQGKLVEEIWVSKTIGKELNAQKLALLMGETDPLYYLRVTGGYVVKRVVSTDRSPYVLLEAVRIEQRNLPESEFRPPPGFTKVKAGLLGPVGGPPPAPSTGR